MHPTPPECCPVVKRYSLHFRSRVGLPWVEVSYLAPVPPPLSSLSSSPLVSGPAALWVASSGIWDEKRMSAAENGRRGGGGSSEAEPHKGPENCTALCLPKNRRLLPWKHVPKERDRQLRKVIWMTNTTWDVSFHCAWLIRINHITTCQWTPLGIKFIADTVRLL